MGEYDSIVAEAQWAREAEERVLSSTGSAFAKTVEQYVKGYAEGRASAQRNHPSGS